MGNDPSRGLHVSLPPLVRRALRAYGEGDLGKAEKLCAAALRSDPGSFDALHCLGHIACQRGDSAKALALFQSALKTDLGRADGFASLGLVFHSLRQFERALFCYDEGLRIAPDDLELLNRRGVAQLELARPREALDDFERVLAAAPDHLEALGNRGNALIKLNRPADALAAYDRALTLSPGNVQLLTNRAVALRRLDRPQEALMSAASALAAKPDFAQARFVEGVARLTLGDFSAGWRGYEARRAVGALASQRCAFDAPQWLGDEPLGGKTILVQAEQGFGDTIQFVRYAALLAARGAAVVLEVQPELVRLLAHVAGVSALIPRGQPVPRCDFHTPLLSLPLAFGTELATIPADTPYIKADADAVSAWRARLPERRPLIGLVWSGESTHDNDHNRSMRLETLAPLLNAPGVAFVSLQHEMRGADEAFLHAHPRLLRIGEQFADFADTAAVMASLDAVVAVDTAVAHLAGAMAKPLFLLLPFAADFRWLRERCDSPWYPTAQLYRQQAFGDWTGAIAALRQDLASRSSRVAA
jgi:tetratricopeptide (TPR) repeat protein